MAATPGSEGSKGSKGPKIEHASHDVPPPDDTRPKKHRSKRAKYSRNGCMACKKRKIKCDEKMPKCSRCERAGLDCVYYRVYRFQPATKEPDSEAASAPAASSAHRVVNGRPISNQPSDQQSPSFDSPLPELQTPNFVSDLLANQELLVGDVLAADERFQDDSIMQGLPLPLPLADYVNTYHGETAADYELKTQLEISAAAYPPETLYSDLHLDPTQTDHLHSFIQKVWAHFLTPFTDKYHSPLIMLLLEKCQTSPYLLNAMLACGARYMLHKARTENNPQQAELHRKARSAYLSNCFLYLKQSLQSTVHVSSELECAIMTSLLLTVDLSSFPDHSWCAHLKGAYLLLADYISGKRPPTPLIMFSRYIFVMLVFCAWAFSSPSSFKPDNEEIAHWLPIPLNAGPLPELYRLGLVCDGYIEQEDGTVDLAPRGNFKVYCGFSDDAIDLIKQLIIARDEPLSEASICHTSSLVEKSQRFFIMTRHAPYRISIHCKYHPLYVGEDKTKALVAAYYHVKRDGLAEEDSWFSFFDFCQQIHIHSAHLFMLTNPSLMDLTPENKFVKAVHTEAMQDLEMLVWLKHEISGLNLKMLEKHYNSPIFVDEITSANYEDGTFTLNEEQMDAVCQKCLHETLSGNLDYSKFVGYYIDHRICMIQWCLLMFGYCSTSATDKIIIECLILRLLHAGINSGMLSLEALTRIWTQRRLRYRAPSLQVLKLKPDYANSFFFHSGSGFLFA